MNNFYIASFSLDEDYLSHHGIKNMHWGEKNGPPYPLSKTKHNKVVRSQERKTARSNKDPFEQSKEKKSFNKDMAKRIAIGAGVTAALIGTGIVATYAVKNGKLYIPTQASEITLGKLMDVDNLSDKRGKLSKGMGLERISQAKTENYMTDGYSEVKRIYASYNDFDIAKYRNRLSEYSTIKNPKQYIHKYTLNNDIKIASEKDVAESVTKLLSDYTSYEDKLRSAIGIKDGAFYQIDEGKYKRFMDNVFMDDKDWTKKFVRDLSKELEGKGIQALYDPNDYSSGFAKAPLILLDPTKSLNITESSGRKLTKFDKFISVLKS